MAGTTQPKPPRHDLTVNDKEPPLVLDELEIIGWVDMQSLKMDRSGCLNITLVIPPEFIERGLMMRALTGTPLSVHLQRWKPAVEATAEIEVADG